MTSFHIAIWGNGNKIHETKAHFVGTARERNWVIFSLCPCYYLLIDRVCVNIHRTLCNTTLQDRQGHICQVMLPPRPSHLTRAVLPDQLLWKNYCPQVTYIEETMCSFCLFAACPFTVLGRRRENESALYFSHTQEKVSDGRLMIKGMKGDEGVNVCETKECVRMALPSLHSVPWMYPIKHANLRTEIHAIRVCSCLCHRIPHAVRKLPSLKPLLVTDVFVRCWINQKIVVVWRRVKSSRCSVTLVKLPIFFTLMKSWLNDTMIHSVNVFF